MATVNTSWTNPGSATLDKSTGDTIDEAMTDGIVSNLYHLGGTVGFIGCRATHSTTQSLSDGVPGTLALNSESFDDDPNGAMHDNASSNSRVTARTAGVYLVTAWVQWAANATGVRSISLYYNSAAIYTAVAHDAAASGTTDQVAATHAYMNSGDYFEISATQTSGGALNVANVALTLVKA